MDRSEQEIIGTHHLCQFHTFRQVFAHFVQQVVNVLVYFRCIRTGRLITPEEFGEIVIRSTEDGEVLKLKDIADVELGKDSYAYKGGMDGHNGVSCMVFQTAGSNATEVNQNIDNLLDEVRKYLPQPPSSDRTAYRTYRTYHS